MSVPVGTTPLFRLTFEADGLDLTTAANVYVTFHPIYKAGMVTKTGEDLVVAEKSIEVYLTQEETLTFHEGVVEIQANWTTPTGGRCASEVVRYDMSKQLLKEVLE